MNPLVNSLLLTTFAGTAALDRTVASVELAAVPEAGANGAWNKLFPAGSFKARDGRGPFHVGDKAKMQALVDRTLKYAGGTELMVDYDHQSLWGAKPGVGGTAKAAGWIKQLEVRDDGIWGFIEWTAAAADHIKAGEYRYLSPGFANDKAGNIHVIFNAGLLNMPAIDLVAVAAGADLDFSDTKDTSMDKIAQALGLDASASAEAILAAVTALQADQARVLTAAGLKAEATTDELVTTLGTLKASATPDPTKYVPIEQVTALQTEVTSLKDSITGDKATAAVEKAIAEGKLQPALKDWGINLFKANPEQFKTFVDKSPALTSTQLGNGKVVPANQDGLTEDDEKVIVTLGLDRAAFIKTREAEKAAA